MPRHGDTQGVPCHDVRTREVGIKDIHHRVRPEQVELVRRDYVANGGYAGQRRACFVVVWVLTSRGGRCTAQVGDLPLV